MQTIKTKYLNLSPEDWVLDIGCGKGRHMHALYSARAVNVIGIDLDGDVLRESREGFGFLEDVPADSDWFLQKADALNLPFVDDSFDAVICSEVLEHLPEYERALEEMNRVLRPGGQLAVSVPRFGPERICWWLSNEYHQVEGGHVRIFRREFLKETIESSGFVCRHSHYAHALHSPLWWLKCLFWKSRDESRLIRIYERILEWEIEEESSLLSWFQKLLNPVFGKSLVLYFQRKKSSIGH